MQDQVEVVLLIEKCIGRLLNQKVIAQECAVPSVAVEYYSEIIALLGGMKSSFEGVVVAHNYVQQFCAKLTQISECLVYGDNESLDSLAQEDCARIKETILSKWPVLQALAQQIRFDLEFFGKLGFFRNNIVAVGANGSGKTSLSNTFKSHLSGVGLVISAQKVLVVPTFSGISNVDSSLRKLQVSQVAEKSYKKTYNTSDTAGLYGLLKDMGGEFQLVLDNLLAERSAIRNRFCDEMSATKAYSEVPVTKLDKALKIWNSLLPHRTLLCSDGINISVEGADGVEYPAFQMSDGEKVLLFLVAQVLQAPESGFVVVDEPEMYLHKTIVNRLWDVLEAERSDCIFIYLTHDLDFAVNRINAKKLWIKSFAHPNKWEIEDIPENDLPEQLLLELLGSRKNVLFCEGKNKSHDAKIYNLLFSQYTICPVESCLDVIHHTKAFNRISNISIKAFGVVDRDHHAPERLMDLERHSVYSFNMAEVENLFLDEFFLSILAARLVKGDSAVNAIKADVLKRLQEDMNLQVSNFVSAKVNYYFHDSHVSKGNDISEIEGNLQTFMSKINLTEWYDKRKEELEEIVSTSDYARALQVYNNKGLKSIAQRHLGVVDFSEFAMRVLIEDAKARETLRVHFPSRFLVELATVDVSCAS